MLVALCGVYTCVCVCVRACVCGGVTMTGLGTTVIYMAGAQNATLQQHSNSLEQY